MPSATLYFKIHQPYRLREYSVTDINVHHSYFDMEATEKAIAAISDQCYLPANEILLQLLRQYNGKFKVVFSISGVTLEILERFRPDVIKSFRRLVRTGFVEIMAETYYNSLSWLYNKNEFDAQVQQHSKIVKRLLGTAPGVFRNTELIYSNELAVHMAAKGYKGILCEGLQRILQGRNPNMLYAAPGSGDFGLLLRHVNLSDDIAFRFDDESWNEFPLTAEKFSQWLHRFDEEKNNVNLFLDYETFGVHKKASTGIFDFLRALPGCVLSKEGFVFLTASEVLNKNYPSGIYDVPQTISWEDMAAANCVCCEHMEQNNMLKKIYSLADKVNNCHGDTVNETWQRLQCADYFFYMHPGCSCTRSSSADPYPDAASAYKIYNSIITDFEIYIINHNLEKFRTRSLSNNLY